MRKIVIRMAAGIVLILVALAPLGPVVGRPLSLPADCEGFAFSTEEDFLTRGPVPPDGKNIISDGDLLGPKCIVCARNGDLLQGFGVRVDLGLDAADVIDAETPLVAFSTELNSPSPERFFTAGDLLATNLVVIPNQALTWAFGQGAVGYDIGLDGLHFVGAPGAIVQFLEFASQHPRDYWLNPPSLLADYLREFRIDIWYSTEGTLGPFDNPAFLDGDVLSARDGIVVAHNSLLLPPSVPAGIPDRGVDMGVDAVTADRSGNRELIHFSTEILFDGEPSFTDGDVLKLANGVVYTNSLLITCFQPVADFIGLDALHLALEVLPVEISGIKFHDLDADGEADLDEPGLERWEIDLDGSDWAGNAVNQQTWTGATGAFTFTVPPGSYEVSEVCPAIAAWYQSKPVPVEGVCGTGVYSLTVAPGDPPQTGVDFGNYQGQVMYLPIILKNHQP